MTLSISVTKMDFNLIQCWLIRLLKPNYFGFQGLKKIFIVPTKRDPGKMGLWTKTAVLQYWINPWRRALVSSERVGADCS